jgi:hypothetical protein
MRSNPLAFAVGKPSFEGSRDVHRARIHRKGALFKGILHQDPERLHRLEPRMFVRVRPFSRSLDVHALLASHPLRSPREKPSCPKGGLSATSYPIALTSALRLPSSLAGEMLLTDFCNQLSDTSTREPFDSRVEAFAFRHSTGFHRTVTASPFDDSVSGKSGLDGALSTSAVSVHCFPSGKQAPLGHLAAALSTACETDDRPLTLLSRSASPLVAQEVFRTLGP